MATSAQLKRRAENQKLLENANIRAALEMISKSEGTNGDYQRMVFGTVLKSPLFPSLVGKKNVRIPDLSRYPQILVKVNSTLNSSAAGKYQIIQKTYAGAAAAIGTTDFSPATQDLLAIELIRQRGAIPYFQKGDIKGAIANTTIEQEWASFAGAGYGQGENSISKLQNWFNEAGKTIVANPAASGGSVVAIVAAIAVFF